MRSGVELGQQQLFSLLGLASRVLCVYMREQFLFAFSEPVVRIMLHLALSIA
jgi:hypothetical protein